MRPLSARDRANLVEGNRIGGDATRVVRRGDDDHSGAGRHGAPDAIGIEREAAREFPFKPIDARAEQTRRTKERVVSGSLDEHFVARLEQGGKGKKVGA